MHDILVVGNVNADWVFRLDAPIRTGLETTGEDLGLRAGGAAANAASALAVADNRVRLVGFIGSDETGDRLLDLMAADGRPWDTSGIVRLPGPTPACLILIDPNGERVIIGTHRNATPPRWPAVSVEGIACAYVASRWGAPDELVAPLKAAGVPIVSQWRPGYTVRDAEVLVVSEDEVPRDAVADPWRALQGAGLAAEWLVVTRGARGATATDGSVRLHCPAVPAAVVDTTGAGDAFAAGLVHGLARRWPMAACLRLGTEWGARAVAHLGSTFPKTGEDIGRYPDIAPVTQEG
ncbi:PfkB family carbohydrate kinase [Pelagibius sp. 7325]|uniref:carbohydrate kinase family protein n=1 Tax=Pelagibius sp. 7325 TaxID=3131994 RepID=UPI0030EE67D0